MLIPVALFFAALGPPAQSTSESLIPAGSINGVFANGPHVFIVDDAANVVAYAEQIRSQFLKDARLLAGEEALEEPLDGVNLLVYGTFAGNAWLRAHASELPFAFEDGALSLQGRRFEGRHLRAVCAVRNPDDRARRAVIYAASTPDDLIGINDVFHGPTEWLVADGGRTLASGGYVLTGALSVMAMNADLAFLVATLADVHPATMDGLPDSVERAIAVATEAISAPLERDAFWSVLTRVLVSLDDAHTTMNPMTVGPSIDLPLVWLREGLVVARDTWLVRRGDLVVSIGGRVESQLLEGLRARISAETVDWVRSGGERALTSVPTLSALGAAVGEAVLVRVERAGEAHEIALPVSSTAPSRSNTGQPWARFEVDAANDLAVFTLD